jgi:hypothetical protein
MGAAVILQVAAQKYVCSSCLAYAGWVRTNRDAQDEIIIPIGRKLLELVVKCSFFRVSGLRQSLLYNLHEQ